MSILQGVTSDAAARPGEFQSQIAAFQGYVPDIRPTFCRDVDHSRFQSVYCSRHICLPAGDIKRRVVALCRLPADEQRPAAFSIPGSFPDAVHADVGFRPGDGVRLETVVGRTFRVIEYEPFGRDHQRVVQIAIGGLLQDQLLTGPVVAAFLQGDAFDPIEQHAIGEGETIEAADQICRVAGRQEGPDIDAGIETIQVEACAIVCAYRYRTVPDQQRIHLEGLAKSVECGIESAFIFFTTAFRFTGLQLDRRLDQRGFLGLDPIVEDQCRPVDALQFESLHSDLFPGGAYVFCGGTHSKSAEGNGSVTQLDAVEPDGVETVGGVSDIVSDLEVESSDLQRSQRGDDEFVDREVTSGSLVLTLPAVSCRGNIYVRLSDADMSDLEVAGHLSDGLFDGLLQFASAGGSGGFGLAADFKSQSDIGSEAGQAVGLQHIFICKAGEVEVSEKQGIDLQIETCGG